MQPNTFIFRSAKPVSDTPLSGTKLGKRFVIVPRFLGTPIEFRKMDPRKLNFWVFLVYIRFLVN